MLDGWCREPSGNLVSGICGNVAKTAAQRLPGHILRETRVAQEFPTLVTPAVAVGAKGQPVVEPGDGDMPTDNGPGVWMPSTPGASNVSIVTSPNGAYQLVLTGYGDLQVVRVADSSVLFDAATSNSSLGIALNCMP